MGDFTIMHDEFGRPMWWRMTDMTWLLIGERLPDGLWLRHHRVSWFARCWIAFVYAVLWLEQVGIMQYGRDAICSRCGFWSMPNWSHHRYTCLLCKRKMSRMEWIDRNMPTGAC